MIVAGFEFTSTTSMPSSRRASQACAITIGPAPIRRTLRSVGSLGTGRLHERAEAPEQVLEVVRSGARLGVVLHRERGEALVAQALDGLVVQVHVGDLDV